MQSLKKAHGVKHYKSRCFVCVLCFITMNVLTAGQDSLFLCFLEHLKAFEARVLS